MAWRMPISLPQGVFRRFVALHRKHDIVVLRVKRGMERAICRIGCSVRSMLARARSTSGLELDREVHRPSRTVLVVMSNQSLPAC